MARSTRAGTWRVNIVDHPGASCADRLEAVFVTPTQGQGTEAVDEPVRPVIVLVGSYPYKAARERQLGAVVAEVGRLMLYPDRLPGREEPGQSTRALVPGEDLLYWGRDDAADGDAHGRTASLWQAVGVVLVTVIRSLRLRWYAQAAVCPTRAGGFGSHMFTGGTGCEDGHTVPALPASRWHGLLLGGDRGSGRCSATAHECWRRSAGAIQAPSA